MRALPLLLAGLSGCPEPNIPPPDLSGTEDGADEGKQTIDDCAKITSQFPCEAAVPGPSKHCEWVTVFTAFAPSVDSCAITAPARELCVVVDDDDGDGCPPRGVCDAGVGINSVFFREREVDDSVDLLVGAWCGNEPEGWARCIWATGDPPPLEFGQPECNCACENSLPEP